MAADEKLLTAEVAEKVLRRTPRKSARASLGVGIPVYISVLEII
jgi:hypothetical protein